MSSQPAGLRGQRGFPGNSASPVSRRRCLSTGQAAPDARPRGPGADPASEPGFPAPPPWVPLTRSPLGSSSPGAAWGRPRGRGRAQRPRPPRSLSWNYPRFQPHLVLQFPWRRPYAGRVASLTTGDGSHPQPFPPAGRGWDGTSSWPPAPSSGAPGHLVKTQVR